MTLQYFEQKAVDSYFRMEDEIRDLKAYHEEVLAGRVSRTSKDLDIRVLGQIEGMRRAQFLLETNFTVLMKICDELGRNMNDEKYKALKERYGVEA